MTTAAKTEMTIECDLVGTTPLGFGAVFQSPKEAGETPGDYDQRCWPERVNIDDNGQVIIPSMGIKRMIQTAASRLGDKIPGRGNNQYAKFILSGVQIDGDPVVEDPTTGNPVTRQHMVDNKMYEDLNLPADGMVGGPKRVWKRMPFLKNWKIHIKIEVFDPVLFDEDLFLKFLSYAARSCGLGRYRPSSKSGGHFGKFKIENWATTSK